MDIVSRAKNICLAPAQEWPVIAAEPTPPPTLISGYVLPLAAIGAVAGLIGGSLVGYTVPFVGQYRVPIMTGVISAVLGVAIAVAVCVLLGMVVNALAPTFGGQKDSTQALKVVVYAYTPAWIAAVLQIVPMLGILVILAGLYGIYLLYLGLPHLMKCPQDKAVGYTVVTVLAAIVMSVILGAITAAMIGVGAVGSNMMMGRAGAPAGAPAAAVDPDSPLGRLEQIGAQMEQSAAKMDEAAKSGDSAAQVDAAMEGLGALLGGGRRVDPLELDALKPFAPETFAGLARTDTRAERTGVATLMMAKVESVYGGEAGDATLEIVDSGGMSGLTSLAGWIGVVGEREDSNGSERTYRRDGRMTHERVSKTGGDNEFGVVIGDRFMVMARSRSLGIDALKSAVASLNLAGLEALKDAGAKR